MNTKQFILSPCGTSLLTNHSRDAEERRLIFTYANTKNVMDIPVQDRSQLEKLVQETSRKVEEAEYQKAVKMSAEFNGIVQIYDGRLPADNDFHFLLSTDTWLGHETAKMVERWLKSKNRKLATMVHRHIDLQTAEMEPFQLSLSELIKKLDEVIPVYAANGFKVIFNLTGGFKSIQGFLQSIAHFYADETVYIFETSSELLRIPRLPVRMDSDNVIEENISFFRNLHLGLPALPAGKIPEIFLWNLDGQTALSPWGELVFSRSKENLYRKALLSSPAPDLIRYGKRFEKNINALPPERIWMVNERIDQLYKRLKDPSNNPASLDFKQLKGKAREPSTHEIDAWSDQDAKRIFGHFEGGTFVLDILDKGLH